jgi:hypothetical protein
VGFAAQRGEKGGILSLARPRTENVEAGTALPAESGERSFAFRVVVVKPP